MSPSLSDRMGDSVTVHIDATPDEVWDLVSDVTRIGEFSPETFEARWTRGATGPEVGAHFKGHVRRNGIGPVYWTLCRVTACEPGEVFEFAVVTAERDLNTWGYRIAPAGEGSAVTEYFRLSGHPLLKAYWAALGWARGRTNRQGMRTTLTRMKTVLETGAARPQS